MQKIKRALLLLSLLMLFLPYCLYAENLQDKPLPTSIKQLQVTKKFVDSATRINCNYNSLKCLVLNQDIVMITEYLEMVKQGKNASDLRDELLPSINQFPNNNGNAIEVIQNYIIYTINNKNGSTSTIYIPSNLNSEQQLNYLKKRNSVLRDLFANNDSVNRQDEFGFSALHYAAATNSLQMVDLLLNYGALIYHTNNDFKLKPDNIAAILNANAVLPRLMTICGREDIDNNRSYNLISYYSYFGSDENILDQIYNFNFMTSTINVGDKFGNTAIFYAGFGNHIKFLDYFINKKQANINIVNDDGKTLLSYMIEYYFNEVAKYLIAQGADVDKEDFSRRTALSYSIINKSYDLSKILLAKGANMNIYDRNNMSPLFYAVKTDNLHILQLFLEANNSFASIKSPNGYNLLTFTLTGGQYNIANSLILLGYNINDLAPDNLTPLMIAAANGKTELVKSLISKGAELDTKSPSDNTALTYSLRGVNADEIAALLINSGANPFIANEDGLTAAGYAALNQKTEVLIAIINQSTALKFMLSQGKYDEISLNLCTYVKQTYHGPCLYNAKTSLLGKV